jgi:exodeoxyribonuclease VII large subunit
MNERLTLTELQLLIRDSLYTALPGFYWVTAEISEIHENYAGHCYLELVEKHPDDVNVRAKIKGIIWNKRYRFIRPLFENSTGESLRPGLKILLKAQLDYHEIYGLSLSITDIDPAFTLGEMALKRQQILRKLDEEGVISMNKELDFPYLPQKIAIISSSSAAGYQDFMKHLSGNAYGYVFYTALYEAVMQGMETESSVTEALDRISESTEHFDIVVIVRGGGSQSDLSWFDNYNIAYHITQFPLPVITGIGHEKDLSVTDIVAHRAEKTPTAVADFIINSVASAEEHIRQLYAEISSLAVETIGEYAERLDNSRLRLIPTAKMLLSEIKENLSGKIIGLLDSGKGYILREESTPAKQLARLKSSVQSVILASRTGLKEKPLNLQKLSQAMLKSRENLLESRSALLNTLSPFNVLKRGYTITSLNGRIIRSVFQAETGEIIETQFADGKTRSRITAMLPEKRKNKNDN